MNNMLKSDDEKTNAGLNSVEIWHFCERFLAVMQYMYMYSSFRKIGRQVKSQK